MASVTTETLQAFADAWNRHDIDALMTFMTDDCVFENAAGPDACGTRHAGREAVRKAFAAVWQAMPDAQWRDGASLRRWRPRHVRVDLHRHARRRHAHRGRRRGHVHVPDGRSRSRTRSQGPADRCRRVEHDDRTTGRKAAPTRSGTAPAARPSYDPRYDPLVAHARRRAGLRADLLGRDRRHAAGGRRPGRRATSMPTSSSSAPASPAYPPRSTSRRNFGIKADGARGQPRRLGLLQPQRRPGPERQRAPVPLAMDRALGTADRARLDAEIRGGFEQFKSLVGRRSTATRRTAATSTSRTGRRKWPSSRRGARDERALRLRHRACSTPEEMRDAITATIARPRARCSKPKASASIRSSSPSATCARRVALGVKVHTGSPVLGWETRDGAHYLRTPGGTVRAKAVGVATGGYTAAGPASAAEAIASCRSCRTRWSRAR